MRLLVFLFVVYVIVSVLTLENGDNEHSSIVYKPKTFSKKAFFQLCRVRRKIKQKCKKNTTKLLIQQLLILSGTVERNPGPWTCTRCNQVFRQRDKYDNHLTKQELSSCRYCHQDFCGTSKCKRHERTCPTYPTTSNQRTETSSVGPWKCTRCAQCFEHYERYQKHLTNQELISCRHCDKNFCRTDRCRQHERTEHIEQVGFLV